MRFMLLQERFTYRKFYCYSSLSGHMEEHIWLHRFDKNMTNDGGGRGLEAAVSKRTIIINSVIVILSSKGRR